MPIASALHVRIVLIRDGPAVAQRRTMHKCRAAMARRALRDRAAATLPPSRPPPPPPLLPPPPQQQQGQQGQQGWAQSGGVPTLSAVAELSEASLLMERAATRAMTPLARAELERRAATARAAAAAAQQAYNAELLHTCTWMHVHVHVLVLVRVHVHPRLHACAQAHDAELLRSAEYTVCSSTCKSAHCKRAHNKSARSSCESRWTAHCKSSCESSSSAQPTAVNSSAAPSAAWLDEELLLGQARAWHLRGMCMCVHVHR